MAEQWSIVESSFDVKTALAYEGLFTQGSGYMHIRGSLEEHLRDDPQNATYTRMPANVTAEKLCAGKLKWGTYVPGVFGPHPLLNNEMLNLPFFLGLVPSVDGEKLDMEASRIGEYRRELCLRDATLRRTLVWHTLTGAAVRVAFERFVSLSRPSLCVQRLTLTADRDVTVEIAGGIDADVRTNGYDHFTGVTLSRARCGERVLLGNHRRGRDRPDDQRTRSRRRRNGSTWKSRAAASFAGRSSLLPERRSSSKNAPPSRPAATCARSVRPPFCGKSADFLTSSFIASTPPPGPRGGRPATSSSRATTARNWPCGPRSITCSAATSPATTALPSTPRATPARPTGGVSSGTPRCTCCRSSSTPTRRRRARCWTSACRA